MAIRKISNIILNGTAEELIQARKVLVRYKHKLIKEPYGKDKLLSVEGDIFDIDEKLKEV